MRSKKVKGYITNKISNGKSLKAKLISFLKNLKLNNLFNPKGSASQSRLKSGKILSRLSFKSLKTKLLLFNAVTISFVIIIIMIFMINTSTNNARNEMQNNLKSQSTAAKIILKNEIDNIKNININIAKNSAFKMLIQMDLKEQLEEILKEYINKYPEIDNIIVYKGDTEIYRTSESEDLKINNSFEEKSGFIQGKHINIFSIEDIVDSNSETIGTIILLHDITAKNKLIKEISTALETNTFLYEGNNLTAMCDTTGELFNHDKFEDTVTIDLKKVSKGTGFLNSPEPILGENYYLYCEEIKDYQGKTLGVLSVGITDKNLSKLIIEISIKMTVIGIVLLALGLLFSWIVSIIITNPIKQLVKNVELVQSGDLTVTSDYTGSDEIGVLSNAFYEMVDTLRKILTDINNKSLMLSDSSREIHENCSTSVETFDNISTAAQDIAEGTNEQVQSIDEAKQQIEEILNDLVRMSDLLSDATEISSNAGKSASLGDNLVAEALNQMGNINNSIIDFNKCLKDLEHESDNIFKIIKVISEIAGQTNLLAMNARIEASKAGDSGKGFTVIASEISKLALKSKDSTTEINKIISDIKAHINRTIEIADFGITQSEKGVSVVADARNTFNTISNNTRDIIEKVNNVSVATERIVSNSKVFTKSFYKAIEVAENTSASVEEIAATLETQTETMDKIENSSSVLSKSANDMYDLVAKFKIN